ncbi:MAG: hypothetical protein AAF581_11850 [Planctomycetota bacterium]
MRGAPLLLLVLPLFLPTPTNGQDDRYIFHSDNISVVTPGVFELPIYLDVVPGTLGLPQPVDGWEYRVCQVSSTPTWPAAYHFVDLLEGSATHLVNNGQPAHYRDVSLGSNGFHVVTLIDFTATHSIPAGVNHEIDRAVFQTVATLPSSASLQFCAVGGGFGQSGLDVWIGPNKIAATQEPMTITIDAPEDDRYHLRVHGGHYGTGTVAVATVELDAVPGTNGSPEDVRSWFYAVCHDPTALQLETLSLSSLVAVSNNGNAPAFAALDTAPLGVDGFSCGVVIDFFGVYALASGSGLELTAATYSVAGAPQSTPLEFCEVNFSPPTPTQVVTLLGSGAVPFTHNGTVTILPPYTRGDCDGNGAVNLVDVLFLLSQLFPTGTSAPPPCARACDTDADGALNLVDAITLLTALFGTPAVPLQEPTLCGNDDSPQHSLECATSANCP